MEYANILFQIEEGLGTLTFNRPQVLNALNSELLKEFSQAMDTIAINEDCEVERVCAPCRNRAQLPGYLAVGG